MIKIIFCLKYFFYFDIVLSSAQCNDGAAETYICIEKKQLTTIVIWIDAFECLQIS